MSRISRWGSVLAMVLGVGLPGAALDEAKDGRLKLVESVPRDDLDATVCATISPDGKFLYSSSWRPATITAFARDPNTGKLEHRSTLSSEKLLDGTTAICLSPDGRMAMATAFRSRTAVLYLRDPETGELSQADFARDGEQGVRMQWPIDAAFSPDGKFAYVLDDQGPGEGGQGAVIAFRVGGGRLELVGTDEGKEGCYQGARGLAFTPDGKTLVVVSYHANAVVVSDHDAETGRTSVRQVIKDDEGDAHGLAGSMGVAISSDGRFVYVSAGRFQGDNAISAFRFKADGQLAFLQEFINGEGVLQGFEGGNHLTLTPDGLNLYAAGTRSGTVACFRRDPATGMLRHLETIPDGGDADVQAAAAGVGVSPDGRFVYVATEDKKSISVFERQPGK